MLKEALLETIWPTRCAVCDLPGEVICDTCARNLPFIDYWRSCPLCGAPSGIRQCTDCAATCLEEQGAAKPYEKCVSSVAYTGGSPRVIKAYKDAGERRLSAFIAECITDVLPPSWKCGKLTIVTVPATKEAYAKRGFDHMRPIGETIARICASEYAQPLIAGKPNDQRSLGRRARKVNMRHAFSISPSCPAPEQVLLVDDVYTTGATLSAAARTLASNGTKRIFCATFARA